MGSLGSGFEDSGCAVEGCRVDETGLVRGGVGKREYLDLFVSIKAESWGKRVRVQKVQAWRQAKEWSAWGMEERRWGMRRLMMHVERCANRSYMWSGW